MRENPFEVLRLDPTASEEEIVRRAGQLRQTASDEALSEIRQAVQLLTGRAEERELFALLTHPSPVHECPSLDRLEAAFRRLPEGAVTPEVPLPPLDLNEVAVLLRPLLLKELEDEPLPLEPPPVAEAPEEILRQTLEGIWQLLPFEPLA